MRTKHILLFGVCLVAVFAIILGLYASSSLTKEIYRADFRRNFSGTPVLEKISTYDLRHNSFYIAGIDKKNVYLGNPTNPALLTLLDSNLSDLKKIRLKLIGLDSVIEPRLFQLKVTPDRFYLAHGVIPVILSGKTGGEWQATRLPINKNDYFDQIVPMSASSFGLRSFSRTVDGYALGKKTLIDTPDFHFNHEALQKQGDGIFSVDGTLHYDPGTKELVYLYSYRNQFIVLDSNITVKSRWNTIDTFSHANVKVSNIKSENSRMLSAPTVQPNKLSYVDNGELFIESNILGKMENTEMFMKLSTIDVYNYLTGEYKYSFYIPRPKGKVLSSFAKHGERIYAIFEDKIVLFKLDRNTSIPAGINKDILPGKISGSKPNT